MQDLAGLTAVILAGGLGTRLRPVIVDRPKILAEIHGRPFLAYLLSQLATTGIQLVVLCTGYLGEQIQAAFGETYGRLRLVYSQEPSPLGTGGALRLALPLVKSDSVLVMNGDSFCEANLRAFWAWHRAQATDGTLLVVQSSDTRRYGRVHVDAKGRLLKFDEKANNRAAGWINAGIYLLKRQLLQMIPPSGPVSLEREMFPAWIGQGLYGYRARWRFIDIGTPQAYALAERFFTSKTLP
jgi:D-glycero-alpha-D-manno-heptose 1-phosphate guanylyltransferase